MLEEVTAGYRVALVYNLVRDSSALSSTTNICTPPSQLAASTELKKFAATWAQTAEGPTKLVHFLDHQYSDDGLQDWEGKKGWEGNVATPVLRNHTSAPPSTPPPRWRSHHPPPPTSQTWREMTWPWALP
jgi:hypothetical protein